MNKEGIVQRLEELKQEKKQLKKQLKELPSLEVGKWYNSDNDSLIFITEFLDSCDFDGYGFFHGKWENKSYNYYSYEYGLVPATDKEVETALIKEAKKRGFKEGVIVESFIHNRKLECKNVISGTEFISYAGINKLHFGIDNGNCVVVFHKGKWAEIIEEPKTVTLNGKYNRIQLTDILNNQL